MEREDINFILQKAQINELENIYKLVDEKYGVRVLQNPTQQTLLQPIIDPISGGEFYAGEILVTTTIVQIGTDSNNKGWAMVQDDNATLSLFISVCDGAFAAGFFKEEIETLINNTKLEIEKLQKNINKKINSTKVSFDLMA